MSLPPSACCNRLGIPEGSDRCINTNFVCLWIILLKYSCVLGLYKASKKLTTDAFVIRYNSVVTFGYLFVCHYLEHAAVSSKLNERVMCILKYQCSLYSHHVQTSELCKGHDKYKPERARSEGRLLRATYCYTT